MRQYFFMGILIFGVLAAVIYFLWTLTVTLYTEWRLRRDVKAIKATNAERRSRREQENSERLDNGCQHVFGETLGGFPPNACTRCGLEREKPPGNCDHVWKMSKDAIPTSYCANCGKKYGGKIAESSSSFRL